MPNRPTIALIAVAAIAAIALTLATNTNLTGMAGLPKSRIVSGKADVGAPFTLTAHTGKRIDDAQFRGRLMVVTFGYTHSRYATPAAMQLISAALDRLGTKAERVQPILITLDPDRDTPPVMADFVARYHPSFLGLTGTPQEIARIAKSYHVQWRVRPQAPEQPKAFDYTALIFVMDGDGTYLSHMPTAATPDELLALLTPHL